MGFWILLLSYCNIADNFPVAVKYISMYFHCYITFFFYLFFHFHLIFIRVRTCIWRRTEKKSKEWYMGTRRYGISLRMFNSTRTLQLSWTLNSSVQLRVRCWVDHEKRNSISTRNHVLFCLSYKHNSPLLTRKADFINEWK